MKMKRNMKRIVSGLLAAVTILSGALSPLAASATETGQEEKKPSVYEEVKDQLDEDEVVTAHDYEVAVGSDFDITFDFTGIDIIDDNKVKVTFEEAKNTKGEDFSTDHADTYKAVYYVEPQTTDHPVYQISRNVSVKDTGAVLRSSVETESESQDSGQTEESQDDGEDASQTESQETEQQTEPQTEPQTDGEPDSSLQTEGLTETELDEALEEAETQDTVDEESGLSVSDVMEQAVEEEVGLFALEAGESVTFMASARANTGNLSVTVTKGSWYYYADYGLGTYLTCPYTVQFGNITATAYCVQPSKPGPGDGVYTINKLSDGKTLAKVCYYGTKASGENGFFDEKHPDFSTGKRFIITHLAAAYANGSGDAFSGTNSTGQALAMELYNYCVSQPDIPDVAMSFSDADVTAYIDGNSQRTKEITFNAD